MHLTESANGTPSPKRRAFGSRLRKARNEAGLTLEQVGRLYGSEGATISRYESGERMPDVPDLPKLAKALGVTVDSLYEDLPEEDDAETGAVAAFKEEMGRRIKMLREQKYPKWTQDDLSAAIGLEGKNPVKTLAMWEQGRNPVPAAYLTRIADALETTVDYLCLRVKFPGRLPASDEYGRPVGGEVVAKLQQLADSKLETIDEKLDRILNVLEGRSAGE